MSASRGRLAFVLACLAIISALGCTNSGSSSQSHQNRPDHRFDGAYPIQVVCTTGQVAELVRRIGRRHVSVDALMGPGVDPHLYTPVGSDVRKMAGADAVFYNGLHLEGRMTELFERMAAKKLAFAVTSGLAARQDPRLRRPPEFEGLYDPHVWHDASIWADCAQDVANKLAEFDPPHAEQYQASAEAFQAELLELDEFCQEQIAQIPEQRRILVTAHDAFAYFGAAYDIEVHGLKGISTEAEKDIGRQEEIQQLLLERRVPAIFVESAVAPRAIESLAEPCRAAGLDLQVPNEPLYADAMGAAGSDAADYAGMMRHNVRTIVDALTRD